MCRRREIGDEDAWHLHCPQDWPVDSWRPGEESCASLGDDVDDGLQKPGDQNRQPHNIKALNSVAHISCCHQPIVIGGH